MKNSQIKLNEINWQEYNYTHHAVVCFIRKAGKILLIIKKRGLGKGKVNGPGGKIDPGETPIQAAIRECEEEVGLTPANLSHHCDLHFIFTDGYSMRGHVFLATDYSGSLTETDEALPFWCNEEEIPYEKMWEDDLDWLPHILKGKRAIGHFIFDGDKILEKKVEIY